MTEPERAILRCLIDERRREVTGATADGLLHGTEMAYRKGKCRCEVCRAYSTELRRKHRHAHPEMARAQNRAYKARRRARSSA